MLISNIHMLLEADTKKKNQNDDEENDNNEDSETNDSDSNDDSSTDTQDSSSDNVDDTESDENSDDSTEEDSITDDDSLNDTDSSDNNSDDLADTGEGDTSNTDTDTDTSTDGESDDMSTQTEQDPIEDIESQKDINRKMKLLDSYIDLYNYFESLIKRLDTIDNTDDIETESIDKCIKKLEKTKSLMYDYLQTMFVKDSYERALSLYYSFKLPINFVNKIITKIAEKRNNS